jgi:fumarate hydratase class I
MELAVYGMFDSLPEQASGDGSALRSKEWEAIAMELAMATKAGAQWGGLHLALETRCIRLARHAANLPLAIGVSCSAHRRARAYMDESGWYIEEMERDPGRFLPKTLPICEKAIDIDLSRPMGEWLAHLRSLPCGTRLTLSGEVCIARDAAHRRVAESLAEGNSFPSYMATHPIFYAGPTEALPGNITGSFGPTTSSRMDDYLGPFLARGGSLVTIGKGGRSAGAKQALATHGGVYLACIGGAAAITARDHITESRTVDYADLGMEAIRIVTLDRLPAIVIIDSKGSDFYENG